jgi:hypothetical protein
MTFVVFNTAAGPLLSLVGTVGEPLLLLPSGMNLLPTQILLSLEIELIVNITIVIAYAHYPHHPPIHAGPTLKQKTMVIWTRITWIVMISVIPFLLSHLSNGIHLNETPPRGANGNAIQVDMNILSSRTRRVGSMEGLELKME